MRKRKTFFEKAGFSRKSYGTIVTVLAVVVAVSSDSGTKLKCDSALKALRRLNRLNNRDKK